MAQHNLNRDEMLQVISDLHKDVYGFRPRGMGYCEMTVFELSAEFAYLLDRLEEVMDEDAKREHDAVVRFEARILDLIACGAGNRATAVRWLRDAQDENWRDDESMCYKHGLPYTYCFETGALNKFERAA